MSTWQESGASPQDRTDEALRIVEMLEDADEAIMRSNDIGFLQKMREAVEQYGSRTSVSPRQLFWLRDIKDRYL